jgi:hypothetical protein
MFFTLQLKYSYFITKIRVKAFMLIPKIRTQTSCAYNVTKLYMDYLK